MISSNRLTGKIPPVICNLTSLEVLDLSVNNLDGNIPSCLGNFSQHLADMNLQMNYFHDQIPNTFTKNNSLRALAFNDYQLEGSLPRSLINCSSLEFLNLANNNFREIFPHWLGFLPELYVLILRFNRFHGPLDNSAATSYFSKLQILDLSHNEFTGLFTTKFFINLKAMKNGSSDAYILGIVRTGYGKYYDDPLYMKLTIKRLEMQLAKTIDIWTEIDFSNNIFCGQIPQGLGELGSLQVLNLSHNSLTGLIPQSLGNLVELEALYLSSNKLSGGIPSELTNLTFLEVFNLSENNLVGPIPRGKQFQTFENDSYQGNPGLCGFPLSKNCGNIPEPPPSMFADPDNGIPFIWKVAMMGYGCGLMLGLSMGYIVFTTGRPWWFVRMIERDWQKNFSMWISWNGPRRN